MVLHVRPIFADHQAKTRRQHGLMALALACVCNAASAQSCSPTVTDTPDTAVEASVETARVAARSAAVWLASGVDSWFGNKPFSEGGQVRDGQLNFRFYGRQDQRPDYSVTFNALFRLPNLETHTYLFTGRDNTSGVVTDRPAAFATKQQLLQTDPGLDTAFFAGLGRALDDAIDARVGFQGGIKLFAQGRYHKEWIAGPDNTTEFSQTFFVTAQDHLGSSTVLSYQHQFSPTLVGRWLNAVLVTQNDPNAEWNTSLGTFWSLGDQRLLSVEILASAKQNSGLSLTDYGVQARWEQPVLHNRLTGEFIVGHFWPQSVLPNQRTTAWAVGTGVKLKF